MMKALSGGKIFILTRDMDHSDVDIEDPEWHYLEGDGDFRSDEVKALQDEADKKLMVIGNQNAITYKEIFPH